MNSASWGRMQLRRMPILERFTTDPRLPLLAFQKNAQGAIDKINRDKETPKP